MFIPTSSEEFVEAYDGKAFNPLEVRRHTENAGSNSIAHFASSYGSSAYKLPTCPVFLERMIPPSPDSLPSPVHLPLWCLSKWGDSRCPVCRYSQTLLPSHPTSSHTNRPSSSLSPSQIPVLRPLRGSAGAQTVVQPATCGSASFVGKSESEVR